MSSSSLRNSSLFCSALLCSSLSHPSLTFFTLLYSARLCSTLCASVCHQVAAGKGPPWPLAQHLRGLGAQILQDEVCPCPCNDCNGHTSPHHRGSGTSANQVRSQPHGKRLCFGCFAFVSMLLHAVPFGLQAHRRHSSALPAKSAILPGNYHLCNGKSRCTANLPSPRQLEQRSKHEQPRQLHTELCEHRLELATTSVTGF